MIHRWVREALRGTRRRSASRLAEAETPGKMSGHMLRDLGLVREAGLWPLERYIFRLGGC